MPSTTLADFRAAAEAHLAVADTPVGAGAPARRPGSVAYLAAVGLECSLKALILKNAAALSDTELKQRQPKLHRALFTTAEGHRLDLLAEKARLKERLQADAPENRAPQVWTRMCAPDRPYSVRYGNEAVTVQDAIRERAEASRLHEEVKNLLGRSRR